MSFVSIREARESDGIRLSRAMCEGNPVTDGIWELRADASGVWGSLMSIWAVCEGGICLSHRCAQRRLSELRAHEGLPMRFDHVRSMRNKRALYAKNGPGRKKGTPRGAFLVKRSQRGVTCPATAERASRQRPRGLRCRRRSSPGSGMQRRCSALRLPRTSGKRHGRCTWST